MSPEMAPALKDEELLHRQVHPNFLKGDGTLMSSAFKPTPKDVAKLSTMRDSVLDAVNSFTWHTNSVGDSAGTWSVNESEADVAEVKVIVDGGEDQLPEGHVSLSFEGKSRGQSERAAKILRDSATIRGRQHPA